MDKSKSPTKPSVKPRVITYAKFLIQKKGTFLTQVKRLLTVTQSGIFIDALNNEPKQHEEILFQDITAIQIAQNSETEFSISTKKNESPTPMHCANRYRCISDIYIALDRFIDQSQPVPGRTFPKFEVAKILIPDNHDLYIDVDLVIYRSHLQLVHKELHGPPNLKSSFIDIQDSDYTVKKTVKIPFYSIEMIYKIHKGIVIEMSGSQAQCQLLLYDMEKTNNVLKKIQENSLEFLRKSIDVNTKDFNEGLTLEYVSSRVYKRFFFYTKVYKILESGHFFPIEIALSDEYILEIDCKTGLVIQKLDFLSVRHVVRMIAGLTGIQVTFDDLTTVTYIPLSHYRGLLGSNIFALANWRKDDQGTTSLQKDFIHAVMPNYNYAVHAWANDEVELEYEVELIKRIMTAADEEQLYQALHEFNMNAILKNYNDSDAKPLQFLIGLFCKNAKIVLSNEFKTFWGTYQIYLESHYPFDFEEQPLVEEERKRSLADYADKLVKLSDKFHAQFSKKDIGFTLNAQSAPVVLYKTEELLKAITILISSKTLFKEIANNKTEQLKYENFLIDVAHLIDSPFPTLSHLAGSFFKSFCRFSNLNEKKNEAINKKYVLTSRVKLIQIVSETLAERVLIKHDDTKSHESAFILSILACLSIIKTFIFDRKETTNPEDFQMILKYISNPYYFAIFNFLSRYRSVACVYDTTIIVNSFFQNCTTRELYKSYQDRFINNSTLILLHIRLALSSLSVFQKKISVVLLSHLFLENSNGCGLICRILPKNLFRKVDFMSNDLSKWNLPQWEQFFSLAKKDSNTPTEQWTEECREELITKLSKIDQDINSKFNYCPPNRLHELFEKEFNHEGEFLINIRWNHEEFEMNYEVLKNKVLVWKYYLTNLLEDSPQPKLSVPINNPAKLWNELNLRSTGANKPADVRLILKVMILLYQEHYGQIKDLNTMEFWLKSLQSREYAHCRYLILQLFYTAFSVPDVAIIRFNVKKFTDIGGLEILSDVLSTLYHNEDHNSITEEKYEELKTKVKDDISYNYTSLQIKKQAYTNSLEKSAMIRFIISIYKCVLYRPIDKTLELDGKLLFPIPNTKYQIIEPDTIKCLMNILLLNDDDLILDVP